MLGKKKMKSSFLKFVQGFDESNPCYRYIDVKVDADGGKSCKSDHSDWTSDQIIRDRGNPKLVWVSWSIKHCDNYFCVDYDKFKDEHINKFDPEILDQCEVYKYLEEQGAFKAKTNKGIHHYIRINGLDYKEYSNQKDVVKGDFDIDLLKKNNIWSPKDRIVEGKEISVEWSDFQKYFDLGKMNFKGKKKPKPESKKKSKPEPESSPEDDSDSDSDDDSDDDDDEIKLMLTKIKERDLVDKINVTRSEWIGIGYALCNHYKGSSEGLEMFDYFSKQYPHEYNYEGLKKTWKGLKKKKEGGNIKATLNYLRKLSDMGFNEFAEIYERKGVRGVVKEMNKVCMFNRKTAAYIVINGNYYYIYSKAQAMDYFARKTYFNDNDKPVNPFMNWYSSELRRDIDEIDYDPTNTKENIYNLWRGFKITHADCESFENAEIEAAPWFDHIKNIWCRGDGRKYDDVIKRFALMLQKPHIISGANLVVKGAEGCGKSSVLDLIGKIMGQSAFMSTSNTEHIFGQFNGMIEGKKLIVLEEAFFAGDKKLVGMIKDFTTSDKTIVNKKNKDAYEISKFSDMIVFTNEEWIFSATPGSRRWDCLECDDKYAGIQTPEVKKYFDKIYAVNPKAIAKILYEIDLTGFNPREFQKTELFQNQVENNWDTVQKFWFRCLKEGMIKGQPFDSYNGVYVKEWLHDDYCKTKWGHHDKKVEYNEFFKRLHKLINNDSIGVKVKDTKRVITYDDTEKPHDKSKQVKKTMPVILLPELDVCRKTWNKIQQWEYTWEETECFITDED